MKVFISSVISGYEHYRDAAAEAAGTLGIDVIRAEDFPAKAETPQQVCLEGVRLADVVILLIGARYGDKQPSGLSATHEEYYEAKDRSAILVFVEKVQQRDDNQEAFLKEVQAWQSGTFTNEFSSPSELNKAVIAALHGYAMSTATAFADEHELVERARALVPSDTRSYGTKLYTVVVGGPRRQVLRPAELETPEFEQRILREALVGSAAPLVLQSGAKPVIRGNALVIEQQDGFIYFNEFGDTAIVVPPKDTARDDSWQPVLIEEEIRDLIVRHLKFIAWLLDEVDAKRRLTDVVALVSVIGASHCGWKTREEYLRNPNQWTMGMKDVPVVVTLTPPSFKRAALTQDIKRIAEDIVVLLRRVIKS